MNYGLCAAGLASTLASFLLGAVCYNLWLRRASLRIPVVPSPLPGRGDDCNGFTFSTRRADYGDGYRGWPVVAEGMPYSGISAWAPTSEVRALEAVGQESGEVRRKSTAVRPNTRSAKGFGRKTKPKLARKN